MSAPNIDALYSYALENGGLGGKIIGAGGGGYLLVYVPRGSEDGFKSAMQRIGSREMEWQFWSQGASVIYSL